MNVRNGTHTHCVDGLEADSAVDRLYEKVAEASGVPCAEFFLLYGGAALECERTLTSYGIVTGDYLQMKMRGRGGVDCNSQMSSSDESVEAEPKTQGTGGAGSSAAHAAPPAGDTSNDEDLESAMQVCGAKIR